MSTHPSFFSRPDLTVKLTLNSYQQQAREARKAGYYNLTTLWYFRQAWLKSQKLDDYLQYLAFRRDLGYPLTVKQRHRLLSWHTGCFAKLLWALTHRHAANLYKKLLRAPQTQHQQLAIFKQQLDKVNDVQLVGNSAELIGKQFGQAIDQADWVLRFNLCFSTQTKISDTGRKTDIWVGAPDFKYPAPQAAWYIITGPDMLNWLNTLPKPFQHKQPLLAIPLQPWRELVQLLGAPPSAGLLTLHWFGQIAPHCHKWLCGFSFSHSHSQYHHADDKHQPVTRHNWQQESVLLQHWLSQNQISAGCKEHLN